MDNDIRDIYQGGYSSLEPNYGELFSGYRTSAELLGTPTAPPGQQGDLPTQLTKSISTGQKVVELSLLNPEIVDTIFKPHLKEIKRIAKLAGVDLSVHGPLLEASGATESGYDKQQREIAEKQIFNALERSHDLDAKGNISVTFHTTNGAPGVIWKKEKGRDERQIVMPLVDQETGKITVAREEERYSPESGGEKEIHNVQEQLRIMNSSKWGNSLSEVEFQREYADKILQEIHPILIGRYLEFRDKQIKGEKMDFSPEEFGEIKKIISAEEHIHEGQRTANNLFDKAFKYGTDDEQKILIQLSKNYKKNLGIEDNGKLSQKYFDPQNQSNALFELKQGLSLMKPQLFKPAEEYTIQESTQSFGNAAWKAYKEFGEKSPVLNIENPPAGMGLSRAEDVRAMVKGSRKQFVENAVREGMSKGVAKKQAEKLIGATWD